MSGIMYRGLSLKTGHFLPVILFRCSCSVMLKSCLYPPLSVDLAFSINNENLYLSPPVSYMLPSTCHSIHNIVASQDALATTNDRRGRRG